MIIGGKDYLKNASVATLTSYICLVSGTFLAWGLSVR